MNCDQFEARLNLVLDQRRSPEGDSALAAHAAVCADCEELLADETALVACVAQECGSSPSRGFSRRVVAMAVPLVARQRRNKRAWLAACVALSSAAAMLLAISAVWKARQATAGSGAQVAARSGVTEADIILGVPHWRSYRKTIDGLAVVLPGAAFRLDEMERIAPGIRPLRESLALIWDTLRRALPTSREVNSPPAENRAEQEWMYSLQVA